MAVSSGGPAVQPAPARRRPGAESGAGLVELLVAAGLGLLGLAVVATVARGPLATTVRATATSPEVAASDLVRQVTAGAVRAARADADGPAVAVAGPDRLVLRVPAAGGGSGWWRLDVVADGAVRVTRGTGSPPSEDAGGTTHRLDGAGVRHVVVRAGDGQELAGPSVGARSAGDPVLARAATIELAPTSDGARTVVVALRPAG